MLTSLTRTQHHFLRETLGRQFADKATYQRLSGLSHHVFRLSWQGDSVIVRVVQEDSPVSVDFNRMVLLHGAAASVDLAPPIVDSSVAEKIMLITDAGVALDQLNTMSQRLAHQHQLGEMLKTLYTLPSPACLRQISVPQLLSDVLSSIEPDSILHQYYSPVVEGLSSWPEEYQWVHGDLHWGNVVFDQHRCWLIDWDYSQRLDPCWDAATFFVESGLSWQQWIECLPMIGFKDQKLEKLRWFVMSAALCSAAWYSVKISLGEGLNQTHDLYRHHYMKRLTLLREISL